MLSEPVEVAGRTHERMTVGSLSFDASMALPGKASLTVFWNSDWCWWQEVASDPDGYRQEKQKAADVFMRVDVSTPLTAARYTGNWMGAVQGWRTDPDMPRALLSRKACHGLPGSRDSSWQGSWADAWGGSTTAAQSGRKVIQQVPAKDRRRFVTTVPEDRS